MIQRPFLTKDSLEHLIWTIEEEKTFKSQNGAPFNPNFIPCIFVFLYYFITFLKRPVFIVPLQKLIRGLRKFTMASIRKMYFAVNIFFILANTNLKQEQRPITTAFAKQTYRKRQKVQTICCVAKGQISCYRVHIRSRSELLIFDLVHFT